MAKVIDVSISTERGIPKKNISEGECIEDFGIKGDAHGGNWHRQISFLAQESIDKMSALGVPGLSAGKFAENVTTQGICLYELPVGTRLAIADAEFEVTQIGKECHRHCAVYQKIGDCVMPREGIFTKVLKGGIIRSGDEIKIL